MDRRDRQEGAATKPPAHPTVLLDRRPSSSGLAHSARSSRTSRSSLFGRAGRVLAPARLRTRVAPDAGTSEGQFLTAYVARAATDLGLPVPRSEEHTSELQSLT